MFILLFEYNNFVLADELKKSLRESLTKYKLKGNFPLEMELLTPAGDTNMGCEANKYPIRPLSQTAVADIVRCVQRDFLHAVSHL